MAMILKLMQKILEAKIKQLQLQLEVLLLAGGAAAAAAPPACHHHIYPLVRLPPELGRSGDDDAALFMVST
jgi:hypothetical protein